ncbi:hypothetical protein E2562_027048 [Oryza meyeriana var. granulata]|uniref:Uncharacterized protein n=1 Tax=Oryza meyeriana var. granulata TaxID=110450 RepID=A0A6G1CAQ2_9ORYZ|nr:hypothetical protein E2562_027048 [Oryza meyeriana var. granulata]
MSILVDEASCRIPVRGHTVISILVDILATKFYHIDENHWRCSVGDDDHVVDVEEVADAMRVTSNYRSSVKTINAEGLAARHGLCVLDGFHLVLDLDGLVLDGRRVMMMS